MGSLSVRRAWIEIHTLLGGYYNVASLSVRRAWIEILIDEIQLEFNSVALRKESVDRNIMQTRMLIGCAWSLSVRRAWIEITSFGPVSLFDLRRSP